MMYHKLFSNAWTKLRIAQLEDATGPRNWRIEQAKWHRASHSQTSARTSIISMPNDAIKFCIIALYVNNSIAQFNIEKNTNGENSGYRQNTMVSR